VEDGMRGLVQQDDETGRGFEVRIGGDDAALVVGVAVTCASHRELAQRPSLGFEQPGARQPATVLDETEAADEIRALETHVSEILAADDVEHLAAAMQPGSVAGVLVWENTWAAPFASAARRAGGQLIATGRIPIQAIAASIEAELAAEERT
jgi:hypothetical protein